MLAVAILTAARAALFAMSLERGEPTLALTVAATRSLADDERLADAIDEAQLALRDWQLEREICSNVTVNRLRHAVLELEPYRQAR